MKTKGVRTLHPTYIKLAPKWKRCSDVVEGQDALHKAGEAYLGKLKDEEPSAYTDRLKRADFFNATWRTIAGLSGMAFRKPPTTKVPAAIEPMLTDIDLSGCSIDDMAKGLVEDMLEYGLFGLLVDHPPMPGNVEAISVAAAEAMGIRPTIKYYEAESITNWRHTRVNNAYVLTMVTLKEDADVSTDQFSHDREDRYRVLDLFNGVYRQRVFRINNKDEDEQVGEDVFPLMNGRPMAYIPFKIAGEMDDPPLIDLVDRNIAHYQINADYRHGLHFTGLPTLFLAGVTLPEGTNFYVGSAAAIATSDPNAKAQFVEFSGQGLKPSQDALDRTERQMAVLGARMLADESKGVETLGATQIKRAGENSILASIASEVSDALEWALGTVAEWVGAAGGIMYRINRDYGVTGLSAQELTALIGAVQAGKVSDSELFDLLQRHDVIDAGKTFDEHQAEVDSAPIPRPANAA